MNYNLANLIDFEIGLIGLIIEFLFGSTIRLNENTEALRFRLVCKKFKQMFDRLAHLSIHFPVIKHRIRNYYPPSEISSIYMFNRFITEQDWKSVFGDKINNLELSLKRFHVNAYSLEYLPKFKYLETILWEVGSGCYDLLKDIPHNELMISRYIPRNGSIAHFTKLNEIEIILGSADLKLIDKHLPPTIRRMIIVVMCSDVVDVINLSKFRSLEYLKIMGRKCGNQLIEELILPPRVYELHSNVKIKKINLHECEELGVLELKK